MTKKSKNKKSNKKCICCNKTVVTITVLALLVVSTTLIYAIQNSQNQVDTPPTNGGDVVVDDGGNGETPVENGGGVDTSDWVTYTTNEDIGISFKYPQNLNLEVIDYYGMDGIRPGDIVIHDDSCYILFMFSGADHAEEAIKDFKDVIETGMRRPGTTVKNININGLEGYTYRFAVNWKGEESDIYNFLHKNRTFSTKLYVGGSKQHCVKIYDEFISTIEPTS